MHDALIYKSLPRRKIQTGYRLLQLHFFQVETHLMSACRTGALVFKTGAPTFAFGNPYGSFNLKVKTAFMKDTENNDTLDLPA